MKSKPMPPGTISHHIGPSLGAAIALGLLLGAAMPLSSVSAGTRAEMTAADKKAAAGKQALPNEAAKPSNRAIVVAGDRHGHGDNKNFNKNFNRKNVVVVRPYKRWNKRPHYGTVIGGVALGTVLGAAAYSAVAPAPNLCWYWADPTMPQGHWD